MQFPGVWTDFAALSHQSQSNWHFRKGLKVFSWLTTRLEDEQVGFPFIRNKKLEREATTHKEQGWEEDQHREGIWT